MVAALYLVALVMVLAGAASVYQGALIFAFSSGATLVTAGVTALTGGVLLAGIAALLGAGRRVEEALEGIADILLTERGPPALHPEPERRPVPPRVEAPPEPAPLPEPDGLRGTLPAAEPAERSIAGTYASGGNSYVMYSDGSVQADTPDGRFDFASVDDLKAFLAKK